MKHFERYAPTEGQCRSFNPLEWCPLRVSNISASLEHSRACADIGMVDAIAAAMPGYKIAYPLRKAIWRGFEDHVCLHREWNIVIPKEEQAAWS